MDKVKSYEQVQASDFSLLYTIINVDEKIYNILNGIDENSYFNFVNELSNFIQDEYPELLNDFNFLIANAAKPVDFLYLATNRVKINDIVTDIKDVRNDIKNTASKIHNIVKNEVINFVNKQLQLQKEIEKEVNTIKNDLKNVVNNSIDLTDELINFNKTLDKTNNLNNNLVNNIKKVIIHAKNVADETFKDTIDSMNLEIYLDNLIKQKVEKQVKELFQNEFKKVETRENELLKQLEYKNNKIKSLEEKVKKLEKELLELKQKENFITKAKNFVKNIYKDITKKFKNIFKTIKDPGDV